MDDKHEKLKIWLKFASFLTGTVAISIMSAMLNHQIQTRELEQAELAQLEQFVTHALKRNVAIRKRFAEFISTVSTSERIRKRWEIYYKLVSDEYSNIESLVEELDNQIEKSNNDSDKVKLIARRDALLSELELYPPVVTEDTPTVKAHTVPPVPKISLPKMPLPLPTQPTPIPIPDKKIAWTGWVDVGGGVGNPCPSGYKRGNEVGQSLRSVGFPPRPQVKHKFECIK